MCTAATYLTNDFYFGRTLDYEFSYGEQVVIAPRNFPFILRHAAPLNHHYAMIGMAHVMNGYPLYYDAINEKGLGIAGLNFVDNACYFAPREGKTNIAQYELIPWLLGACATVREARAALADLNITNLPFHEKLPLAQLHWIIADREEAITLESTADGLHIYDNPAGVLTNNPPFPQQMFNLNQYMHLSVDQPRNTFGKGLALHCFSRGMGALGLPGDVSSISRFVRVAFTKMNSLSARDENASVSQFFHILGSVDQVRGLCRLENGEHEITIYTSCANADKGIYYYTTYDNQRINAVDMRRVDLDKGALFSYPLRTDSEIFIQN